MVMFQHYNTFFMISDHHDQHDQHDHLILSRKNPGGFRTSTFPASRWKEWKLARGKIFSFLWLKISELPIHHKTPFQVSTLCLGFLNEDPAISAPNTFQQGRWRLCKTFTNPTDDDYLPSFQQGRWSESQLCHNSMKSTINAREPEFSINLRSRLASFRFFQEFMEVFNLLIVELVNAFWLQILFGQQKMKALYGSDF